MKVTLSETYEVDDGEDYDDLYDQIRRRFSARVEQSLVKEVLRYQKKTKRGDDE